MKTLLTIIAAAALLQGCAPANSDNESSADSGDSPNTIRYSMETRMELAKGIRARGFACERVNIAYARPPSAYGDVQKLYCGPTTSDDTYTHTIYKVTVRPNDTIMIEPSSVWSD